MKKSNFLITREMRIAGQDYILVVKPSLQPDDGDTCYIFTLKNKNPNAMIPGGIILRILDQDKKVFIGSQIEAKRATRELTLKIWLKKGEPVFYDTVPLPENYTPDILSFN